MLSPDVDTLLAELAHPSADVIHAVRAELLALPGVVESIKWKSPNYALADDFATMNLRKSDSVQLILHTGAKPNPEHPEIVIESRPAFARVADRNRLVLTFTRTGWGDEDLSALHLLLGEWVAQLR